MNTLLNKLFSKALFTKMVLTLSLVLGATQAWGDEIYFDAEVSATLNGWTAQNHSQRTWSAPYYIYKNTTGATLTSNNEITFTALNKLVINSKYYSSVDNKIEVKYSNDNGAHWTTYTTITNIAAQTKDYEITGLIGNYKIQLVFDYAYIYKLSLVGSNPYPTPENFKVDSYDETSVDLSWSKAKDEEGFQLQYIAAGGTDSTTVNLGNETTTTTLNDLTTNREYKAKLRSVYVGGHYSAWTEEISFTPRDEFETVVNDGSNTNNAVPFYGSSANSNIRSQFIIPASSLEGHKNRQITKLVFHSSNATINWGTAKFEVYLKETSKTVFSSKAFDSWGTTVYNSAFLSVSGSKMEITLDTPFNYSGGNLMIGFKLTATGTGAYNSFYGLNGSTNTCISGYGSPEIIDYKTFLPKITITSTSITTDPVQMDTNGFATYASPRKLDLTTAGLGGMTAYKAEEIDTEKAIVRFTEINEAVAANTGMLLKGDAGKTYYIPVAASGSDISGTNKLLVNTTGNTFDGESGYTYFAMKKNSDPLKFATFDPSSVAIPSNKAYLKVLTSSLEGRELSFSFEEETTGIQQVNSSKQTVDSYYNLAGQRVATPSKGLYIMNGKKVVMK